MGVKNVGGGRWEDNVGGRYVFGGRGRTRTDADILFLFKKCFFLFFFVFFLAYIYLRAQLERDPESDRLGHPPPPPISKLYE